MSRPVNPDHIKWWFNLDALKGYLLIKGYRNYAPLVNTLHVSDNTIGDKINYSRLDHEDTIKIAERLDFTLEQYRDVFLKDAKLKESTK